jgi:hypothetical protein
MHSRRLAPSLFAAAIAILCHSAQAQHASCDLTTMSESIAPVYPAIAKAAHVEGPVVLLVSFKTTGEADTITVIAGPAVLRQNAVTFVQGWRANPFTGPRTCPISIDFHLQNAGDKQVPFFVRKDPQHGIVNSGVPVVLVQALPAKMTTR